MPLSIQEVRTHLFDLPVLKKRTDAIQSFASMETLVVELRTSDGLSGTGYSYTIGTGGWRTHGVLCHVCGVVELAGHPARALDGPRLAR